MDNIETGLASIIAGLSATARAPDPFRVVEDRTADGYAVLRCDGRCVCRNGFTFGERDGYTYAEPCRTCGPARRHADRINAARLPMWAHRLRAGWRDDVTPLQLAADLASRIHDGRDLGRTYHGGAGRGKSWRACAVAMACIDLGMGVMWLQWGEYMAALKDRLSGAHGALGDLIARPLSVEVLVVDDLARGSDTDFAREVAERIVGGRAERQSPMLITSNRTPVQLRDYLGDRAWSRLSAYRVTEVSGVDMRGAA